MSGLWDLGVFRLRRYAQVSRAKRLRLEEAQAAARRERRRHMTLRKVSAQVRLGETGSEETHAFGAQVILSDFTQLGLKLYSSEPVGPGQEILVALDAPRPLFARALVRFCYEFTQSGRILRGHHFPYRVGVEFIFESEDERSAIAGYCRELRRAA